jgi:hypothetical protein
MQTIVVRTDGFDRLSITHGLRNARILLFGDLVYHRANDCKDLP